MYRIYFDDVVLPVAPEKVTMKINNQNKTLNLINEGEINLLKTPGLTDISFSFLLPTQKYPFAIYKGNAFQKPSYYLSYLETLKIRGIATKFRMLRFGNDDKNRIDEDVSMSVSVETWTISDDAANGYDIMVAVELKQYKFHAAKVVTFKKQDNKTNVSTTAPRPAAPKTTAYTVAKGDTLWAIAKRFLGNGSKNSVIYNANKSAIEAAAKKNGRKSSSNGYWIYPGTKLSIPKG